MTDRRPEIPEETASSGTPRKTRIVLKRLEKCTSEQQMAVRNIRNQLGVRRWMYADREIDADEHMRWVRGLGADARKRVFAALDDDGGPVGVVYLYELDFANGKSDWGFYVDPAQKSGLGAALEFGFIDYVFATLGLEKLNCEVLEANQPVVKLHTKFHFVHEGMRRENIRRGRERLNVVLLGLTRPNWLANRDQIFAKYQIVFGKYEILIESGD